MMNGNELLKRLKKVAKARGVQLELIKRHGKGSHSTVCFGDKCTTIKDRKKEIGKGLLKAMLSDMGLNENDI